MVVYFLIVFYISIKKQINLLLEKKDIRVYMCNVNHFTFLICQEELRKHMLKKLSIKQLLYHVKHINRDIAGFCIRYDENIETCRETWKDEIQKYICIDRS